MKPLFFKFIKFAVVGSLGTVIDFAVTAFIMIILGLREYITESIQTIAASGNVSTNILVFILIANLAGFVVAASTNYILNRIWTWKSTEANVKKQYFKFFSVSVIGLIINLIVIYICNTLLAIEFTIAGIFIPRFWFAKLVATAVVMVWNFTANNLYTFRTSKLGN